MRAALIAAALLALPAPALARTFSVDSGYGSGSFGTWGVDDRGMPRYRYTIDEETAPQAAQEELNGKRDAWHQLGNDHIVADAFNHGYTQLWTMDHLYQWANYAEPSSGHYGGGYGYLNVDGKLGTTLYDDRAPGQDVQRDFGVGYVATHTALNRIDVTSRVYAPFGDDPLLLHDVVLRNTDTHEHTLSWFEYWDVNPYFPGPHSHPGLAAPTYDAGEQILRVAQLPSAQDLSPLTIFAAPLNGTPGGYETDANAFFGAGGRKAPDEAKADELSGSPAAPAPVGDLGHTAFVFRSPATLAPGQSITLRYAYGMTHADAIGALVDRYRSAADPFGASESHWARWLPQADFGGSRRWLARELQWDAYMVRSGATYEDCAGHHVISQGGYYQYDLDFQGAFRDPLQHVLPMIYSDPYLARETLLYSAGEQPAVTGAIPYARVAGCNRFDLGTSDDLDLWLLLTAAEYGLATRDLAVFDEQVPYEGGAGPATLWDHLKLAVDHQESQRGPHGLYLTGTTGDWSDLATPLLQMTESTLVAAQAAAIYPLLARLADLRGDPAFAARLRALTGGLTTAMREQWTARGWYTRGYSGTRRLGTGVIYGEPQPWAVLAGIPDAAQATKLVANIRRYLTGIGAPGGPSKIGSSQSPAANDPGVTETDAGANLGVGDKHAVFVGGQWFAVNGWLVWALAHLDGVVPHARADAFDEFERNTLAVRATVYPDHWDGILSVDDACRSWYSTHPEECGIGLSTSYDTQIMHQPAWSLFDAIKLAGVEPDTAGYTIAPHVPLTRFTLNLPRVGVTKTRRSLSGYLRLAGDATLRMRVAAPAGRRLRVTAGRRRVRFTRAGGLVVFSLPVKAGRAARWAVRGR